MKKDTPYTTIFSNISLSRENFICRAITSILEEHACKVNSFSSTNEMIDIENRSISCEQVNIHVSFSENCKNNKEKHEIEIRKCLLNILVATGSTAIIEEFDIDDIIKMKIFFA